MQITYNSKSDLLYLRLDSRKQKVRNERVTDDIVLDIGEKDRIVGIEILDASKHVNLEALMPVWAPVGEELYELEVDGVRYHVTGIEATSAYRKVVGERVVH